MITGIHHITAFAKDPRANVDFYKRAIGLRLVKKTVNFDDPFTYHLYYGDHVGSPGTLLTHFPNPRASKARHGNNEIAGAVLAVPTGLLAPSLERLRRLNIDVRPCSVLGEPAHALEDPDGMQLLLIERHVSSQVLAANGASGRSHVGGDDADRGQNTETGDDTPGLRVDSVLIRVPHAAETANFLTKALGFTKARRESDGEGHNVTEYTLDEAHRGIGQRLLLIEDTDAVPQPMGAGTIHHVAWRVLDHGAQVRAADAIRAFGVGVTPIIDRQYFQSIYFRIPGGVVFEIATDGPGFAVDEPLDSLGESLMLPPQHEALRTRIEQTLMPIESDRGTQT